MTNDTYCCPDIDKTMSEAEMDSIIEDIRFAIREAGLYSGRYIFDSSLPPLYTALAQWIRIKNDVINKRIHESIIKHNEPEQQPEPELEPDGKPF